MNGMTVHVPENTVLIFSPDVDKQNKRVCFHIGGVIFETDEEVVLRSVPDSFLAVQISSPMNANARDTPTIKERTIEWDKPELFPLIFDFLVRKFVRPRSVLRTIKLTLDAGPIIGAG